MKLKVLVIDLNDLLFAPLLATLLRHLADGMGAELEVETCGLHAVSGEDISEEANQCLMKHGVAVSDDHRSRNYTDVDIGSYDFCILCTIGSMSSIVQNICKIPADRIINVDSRIGYGAASEIKQDDWIAQAKNTESATRVTSENSPKNLDAFFNEASRVIPEIISERMLTAGV